MQGWMLGWTGQERAVVVATDDKKGRASLFQRFLFQQGDSAVLTAKTSHFSRRVQSEFHKMVCLTRMLPTFPHFLVIERLQVIAMASKRYAGMKRLDETNF
jgi:hypothetical protein